MIQKSRLDTILEVARLFLTKITTIFTIGEKFDKCEPESRMRVSIQTSQKVGMEVKVKLRLQVLYSVGQQFQVYNQDFTGRRTPQGRA